jgi:cell division protein FtsZ
MSSKRASMREGPLAALFRKTEEDQPQDEPSRRPPREDPLPEPRRERSRPEPKSLRPQREAEPTVEPRVPSPKERLSAVFAHDVPHDVLERPRELGY